MWSLQFSSHVGIPILNAHRFGPSRHIREGSPRRQLYHLLFFRLYCGIFKKLAACSGYVFHFSLDVYLGCHHEQIRFQVHPVRFTSRDSYELRTHSIPASHSSMLPKVEHSQRKSCLPFVPLMLSALRMCLRPCMMLPSRRPTTWIADLQSPRASVSPVYSLRCMLPMASVSP